MSSPWTTSAATKARPLAPSSEPKAPTSFFLPLYSSDLNPIEQVFAKLKHLIRKTELRDLEATWRRVG
jgi:transposase